MSDLQISLIGLGVILIGIVLGMNWWQDRRLRQRMEDDFGHEREDPLLGEAAPAERATLRKKSKSQAVTPAPTERREPGLGSGQAAPQAKPGADDDEALAFAATAPETDDPEEPDPVCEAVIDLVFDEPVEAESLLPVVRDLSRAGRKPIRVFFRTTGGVHCSRLRLGVSYVSMQLAVLLANRSGPLSPTEWSQAWAKAQEVADQFDAAIEGPDPREISQLANALDEVCASLDTSVGLTLLARGPNPWRLAEVEALALDLGFSDQGVEHRYDWLDKDGGLRFSLLVEPGNSSRGHDATTQLTLLLDVPRSAPSATPFADMARVARELAAPLDAELVDDNGQPLQEGTEPAVDKQLLILRANLERQGMPAGSARALRVFH